MVMNVTALQESVIVAWTKLFCIGRRVGNLQVARSIIGKLDVHGKSLRHRTVFVHNCLDRSRSAISRIVWNPSLKGELHAMLALACPLTYTHLVPAKVSWFLPLLT